MCPSSCNQPKLQSTPLLQGKTKNTSFLPEILNASIHFPLAREDLPITVSDAPRRASIHFPLAREDMTVKELYPVRDASIHFPLAREDLIAVFASVVLNASIHFPLAREDGYGLFGSSGTARFNPLPSCEGRHRVEQSQPLIAMLQSTSLLRGKTANFTKNHLPLFYNLICFHHTISYYFYSRYEFRCHLFIISSF